MRLECSLDDLKTASLQPAAHLRAADNPALRWLLLVAAARRRQAGQAGAEQCQRDWPGNIGAGDLIADHQVIHFKGARAGGKADA